MNGFENGINHLKNLGAKVMDLSHYLENWMFGLFKNVKLTIYRDNPKNFWFFCKKIN